MLKIFMRSRGVGQRIGLCILRKGKLSFLQPTGHFGHDLHDVWMSVNHERLDSIAFGCRRIGRRRQGGSQSSSLTKQLPRSLAAFAANRTKHDFHTLGRSLQTAASCNQTRCPHPKHEREAALTFGFSRMCRIFFINWGCVLNLQRIRRHRRSGSCAALLDSALGPFNLSV